MSNETDQKMMNPPETKLAEKDTTSPFGITRLQIDDLFDKYDSRNFIEEVEALEKAGGNEGMAKMLNSSIVHGLSADDNKEARIKYFGSNFIVEEPLPHCCHYVLEALEDLMLRILILAAIVQIALGASPLSHHPEREWVDGVSILFAVCIVVAVGSITNFSKEKKFHELNEQSENTRSSEFFREDRFNIQSPNEILVGDLIKISTGTVISADGMLVSSQSALKVDESSLTGESEACEKETIENCLAKAKESTGKTINKHSVPSPMVFSGTKVEDGVGIYLVLAVGVNSKRGKIQQNVQANLENEDSKTPLENKLDSIATDVGYFGILAAVLTFVSLIIRFGVTYSQQKSDYDFEIENPVEGRTPTNPQVLVAQQIISILLLCVAIIVVAIPEGLPLAVTLALAFSINKMMNDNNLVRKMHACETMGGANFICSDKTGTLTQNKMCINKFFNGKEIIDMFEVTLKPDNKFDPMEYLPKDYYEQLAIALYCNIQITIDEREGKIIKCSKTDESFVNLLTIFGVKIVEAIKTYIPNLSEVKKFEFTSTRKRMSTIIAHSSFPTGYRIYTKGASEYILKSVSDYLNPNDMTKKILTDEDYVRFEKIITDFANATLRTITVAYKDLSKEEYENYELSEPDKSKIIEKSGFTMLCIVGIKDTLRDGVIEAIGKCHKAGISVVMVTGDLKETAIAISKECKIYNLKDEEEVPPNYSLTGEEFYKAIEGLMCETCGKDIKLCEDPKTKTEALLQKKSKDSVQKLKVKNMEVFKKISKELRVVARCRPEDKFALVTGLRALEHVVAVTGDGTNDAQALSKSDVGFAMGQEGTDIAKDAADIIIMDDNFASIVQAVKWGRNIYDNIRKFIQFQLTVNVTACLLVFVTACIGNETPITAIQMLWLNLIMDSLGSLALATEPPHDNLLNRKPNSRQEYIINYLMWKHVLGQSMVLFTILLIIYLEGFNWIPEFELYRIVEMKIIGNCYDKFPGVDPAEGDWAMAGSSLHWPSKSYLNPNRSVIDCGIYANDSNMSIAFGTYRSTYGNTAHMTVVFNVFVFYTIFNQINARVIDDGKNIFYNIQNNILFAIICITEAVLQAILIQFGSIAFSTSLHGITPVQWAITIGFSLLTYPVAFILKLIPAEKCIESIANSWNKCKKKKVESKKTLTNTNAVERANEGSEMIVNSQENKLAPIKKELSKKKTLTENMRKGTIMGNKQSSKIRN